MHVHIIAKCYIETHKEQSGAHCCCQQCCTASAVSHAKEERVAQEHQWSCRNCGCAYELAAIEAQLLRSVRLRARAYQLQDLRCIKCRQAGA